MRHAFGSWLRGERLRRHVSQETLAANAQISESYLSDIERSRRDAPSDDVLDFLAVALDIDRDVMFFRAGRLTPDIRELIVSDAVVKRAFAALRQGLHDGR